MQVRDDVAYIGLKEEYDHVLLYPCMQDQTKDDFNATLHEKLERQKRPSHAQEIAKNPNLRKYLLGKVQLIETELHLTMVTDFERDHLLTVNQQNALFVYFGAMTKALIHVACWLRIPKAAGKFDGNALPQMFFWVLHTSYAQELEALGDLKKGLTMDSVKQFLDLSEGIEST